MTAEGYLDVSARISRSGVQQYYAGELGDLFADYPGDRLVNVYRPPEEVFKPESMASFAKKPVTDGHPWEGVTASNVKDVQVGFSGETMRQDTIFVSGSLMIQDAAAVNRVQRGDAQLSAGYEADLTRESGTSPDGVAYDAVQRNITGNHIALVDAGRCGPLCRVGDRAPSRPEDAQKAAIEDCSCKGNADMTTATVVGAAVLSMLSHDGFNFQADAIGATIFGKLKDQAADLKAKLDVSEGKLVAADAAHKDALTKKDAEITTLKAGQLDAAAIDKLVAARTDIIGRARKVLGDELKTDGKSNTDIMREVVASKIGDDKVKDKADAVIEAQFDIIADQASDDGAAAGGGSGGSDDQALRDHFKGVIHQSGGKLNDSDKAYDAMRGKMENAWKNPQPAKA